MTTVAYRDGTMASDSLVAYGDVDAGGAGKVFQIGPVLLGFSGCLAIGQRFVDWVRAGMRGDAPDMARGGNKASAIIVHDGYIVSCDDSGWDRLKAEYYAIGSGRLLALGAMAHGASAEEAVRAAIRHDIYSGGAVQVVKWN